MASSANSRPKAGSTMDVLLDIELPVTIRFASKRMLLGEIIGLHSGSVIDVDRTADDPVEMIVNGRVVARGMAVAVNGNCAIRITQIEDSVG